MTQTREAAAAAAHPQNGDKDGEFTLSDGTKALGIGSFHKSLPHDSCGEVDAPAFQALLAAATLANGAGFDTVVRGTDDAAQLTNPSAGLSRDRLVGDPASYTMPPAPGVLSDTTAAEMTELYWMALLRDVPFNRFPQHDDVRAAASDVDAAFKRAVDPTGADAARLRPGIDIAGHAGRPAGITPSNLFRLGLAGEDVGPMVSQFFMRPVPFGTQTIDVRQLPYAKRDYLIDFDAWLAAQNSGRDAQGQAYPDANEDSADSFEQEPRYISTMRDLARFVNKDALHQAYFNAALLLLSGGAKWTPGNPFADDRKREAGFGLLGGPHILSLVSEVASRALKTVWFQKWQVHLRLRPEAYGGLAHVQTVGNARGTRRPYGLPSWLFETEAARRVRESNGTYLLPMAYTPGSPTHPAYGAGHATVAGACVTVLKAYFVMLEPDRHAGPGADPVPIPFNRLGERHRPHGTKPPMTSYVGAERAGVWDRMELGRHEAAQLTIEGELNKLAQNVALGRSMGGVHWRTDNARSLVLGEALAAQVLSDISRDANVDVTFTFRTFARGATGKPRTVVITSGNIAVDGGAPRSASEL